MVVKTQSGSVNLKRVAGGRACVTMSSGGPDSSMRLGVLQCGGAEIDSGGSDIHIKQIASAPESKDPEGWSGEGMRVRCRARELTPGNCSAATSADSERRLLLCCHGCVLKAL